MDLLVRARHAVTSLGEGPAAVLVRDGLITEVAPALRPPAGCSVVDLGEDEVLLPGLVDSHVHVDEPGHADWEGFASATRAAAAGGVTTLVDMPLDSVPVTVNAVALAAKRSAAEGKCQVDVGFWGGVVPGNLGDLAGLHEAGVLGFKCFLADSGAPDFPPLAPDNLEAALKILAGLDAVLLVHAESDAEITPVPAGRAYAGFLASRPPRSERTAVAALLDAARRTGARVHVVHVSDVGTLPLIAAARRDGVLVTAETCPHYLTLAAEDVPDGATEFACCPPIREAANQDALWQGLAEGVLDLVVSDHSPGPGGTGDFSTAWGGISSLQLALPAVWTEARRRGFSLADIARWMGERPALLAGLPRKGRIAPGYDADLSAFAADATFVIRAEDLHHRRPVTPYAGCTLRGVVRRTWLRGCETDPAHPAGRLLGRTTP